MPNIDRMFDLVDEARSLFSGLSVFEVMDLDETAAIEFLNYKYDNPNLKVIGRYLEVIERIRSYSR